MQVLRDSNGDIVWLFLGAGNPATTSIGLGAVGEPFREGLPDTHPTCYYWVPLPVQIDLSEATAQWTDWIQWDVNAQQLWWGKVRLFPKPGQHVHEIVLPAHAVSLKPHEIHKRLKGAGRGKAPTFS
jgi:hypothetical protein